jgi:hypothetical protein
LRKAFRLDVVEVDREESVVVAQLAAAVRAARTRRPRRGANR